MAEKLFDGCYIVSGELPKEKMAASEVIASYKKLGLVEEAFRSLKTVQLEVRPVYHMSDDRILCATGPPQHLFRSELSWFCRQMEAEGSDLEIGNTPCIAVRTIQWKRLSILQLL